MLVDWLNEPVVKERSVVYYYLFALCRQTIANWTVSITFIFRSKDEH